MPSKAILNAVEKTIKTLPGWREFLLLDVSCGDGELIQRLSLEGCRVEGTHFRQNDYIFKKPAPILKTAALHGGIDLCRPLPFADGTYDVVMATEVLEHLPSHLLFYDEAVRILKPGGHLILTTPNVHCLTSRLRFFLTGQHELRGARLGWHIPADALYSTHHNPVYFPVIHTLLHQRNLEIVRLVHTRTRLADLLTLPLYPLVLAATMVEARHGMKRSPAGGRDLLRWMIDLRMLLNKKLMLLARKGMPSRG